MIDERAVLDEDEQVARCRALEMMVLLRALLDAAWKESDIAHRMDTPQNKSVAHSMRAHRAAARWWLLSPVNREHIETIAERAGLPDDWIWILVRRFVRDGEDPAPLRQLYQTIGDRPGAKKFEIGVAFVN